MRRAEQGERIASAGPPRPVFCLAAAGCLWRRVL